MNDEVVEVENDIGIWDRLAAAGLVSVDIRFDDFVDADSDLVVRDVPTEESILAGEKR